MKHIIIGLLTGALLLATPAAFAQEKDSKGVINNRKERQKDRIEAGVKDGSLTKGEAAKLKAEQAKIRQDIRQERRDGGEFTAKEKAKTASSPAKADTGSAHVQVTAMTARINEITAHLKTSKKDHMARRGLLQLVGKRKKLLKYIAAKDGDAYLALIKELGIRR